MVDDKPSALLLGDSISIDYREFVRENLRGVICHDDARYRGAI